MRILFNATLSIPSNIRAIQKITAGVYIYYICIVSESCPDVGALVTSGIVVRIAHEWIVLTNIFQDVARPINRCLYYPISELKTQGTHVLLVHKCECK